MYACRVSKLLVLSGYRSTIHTSPLFLLLLLLFDPLFRFCSICSFFSCNTHVSIKKHWPNSQALNKHIFLDAKTNWIVVVVVSRRRCRSFVLFVSFILSLSLVALSLVIISQADGLICTHTMSFYSVSVSIC